MNPSFRCRSATGGARSRAVAIVLLAGALTASPRALAAPDGSQASSSVAPLDRVIGPRRDGQPFAIAAVSRYAIWELSTAVRVPMGIESLPAIRPAVAHQIEATGRTLREVLDGLVAADPRYEWREMDGVIVIRPASAWSDPENSLATAIAGVRLRDVTVARATATVTARLGSPRKRTPAFADTKRVSIVMPRGTILDLLNAIAREHGELAWAFGNVDARDAERTGYHHELSLYVMGGTGSAMLVR